VTSEAKLFAIVFEGNSRPAFFGSKIGSYRIWMAQRADFPAETRNVSGECFRCIKVSGASKLHRVKLREET
jgi:hypothetical protein